MMEKIAGRMMEWMMEWMMERKTERMMVMMKKQNQNK